MKVVLFDIDGTLADCTHRAHHLMQPKKDWDAFYAAMADDTPRPEIIYLASLFWKDDVPVILCTGRPLAYRAITERWLSTHNIRFHAMYMRQDGDFRDDTIVKREMLNTLRILFEPIMVVDDRAKVVAMWREEGLACLQCAPGEF